MKLSYKLMVFVIHFFHLFCNDIKQGSFVMAECLFCKIVSGELPCRKVYEDESVLGFEDIHPVAPLHFLFIPKIHVENFYDASTQKGLIESIFSGLANYLDEIGQSEEHFRIVSNKGSEAGQSVFHFHVHLIGKRSLQWPPG